MKVLPKRFVPLAVIAMAVIAAFGVVSAYRAVAQHDPLAVLPASVEVGTFSEVSEAGAERGYAVPASATSRCWMSVSPNRMDVNTPTAFRVRVSGYGDSGNYLNWIRFDGTDLPRSTDQTVTLSRSTPGVYALQTQYRRRDEHGVIQTSLCSRDILVGSDPDLIPVGNPPYRFNYGSDVNFTFDIKNIGVEPAYSYYIIESRAQIDEDGNGTVDANINSERAATLMPSESETVSTRFTWNTGSHTNARVRFEVDKWDHLAESDEANNVSPWYDITLVGTPPPTANLEIRVNGGAWQDVSTRRIAPGDDVDLRWTSTRASSCTATAGPGFSTGGRTSGTDTTVSTPGPSHTFTVECSGAGGSGSDSITVNVVEPTTADLQIRVNGGSWQDVSSIDIAPFDDIDLRWTSQNATACSAWNGPGFFTGPGRETSGTDTTIEPMERGFQRFTIWCSGPGGSGSDSIFVSVVEPPATANLKIRVNGGSWQDVPTIDIGSGDDVDLRWTSQNATSCFAWNGPGFSTGGATSGTDTSISTPGPSHTFTVACSGAGKGGTDSITVNVGTDPVTADLEIRVNGGSWRDVSTIEVGSSDDVDLRWTSQNATSCFAGSGPGFSTGGRTSGTDTTISISGPSHTFTVQCYGAGGNDTDSIFVDVMGRVALDATPTLVDRGEDTDITWDVSGNDPATCSLTGPGISMPSLTTTTGSQSATILGESTYTLDCGTAGSATVTVTVRPVFFES